MTESKVGFDVGARYGWPRVGPKIDILLHRHWTENATVLRHERDPAPRERVWRHAGDRAAIEVDLAG